MRSAIPIYRSWGLLCFNVTDRSGICNPFDVPVLVIYYSYLYIRFFFFSFFHSSLFSQLSFQFFRPFVVTKFGY